MPLKVTDLQPGDRVVLNCPKSRFPHKEAVFEGIFASIADAAVRGEYSILVVAGSAAEFVSSSGERHARFLFQSSQGIAVTGAFVIEADGSLREESGRRVVIERRLRMGQG